MAECCDLHNANCYDIEEVCCHRCPGWPDSLSNPTAFRPTGLRPDITLAAAPPLRIRLAGRPYLAAPHPDRPGYHLEPDRARRFADRQETMTP